MKLLQLVKIMACMTAVVFGAPAVAETLMERLDNDEQPLPDLSTNAPVGMTAFGIPLGRKFEPTMVEKVVGNLPKSGPTIDRFG